MDRLFAYLGTNAITLVPTGGNTIDADTANYVMKRNFGSWLLVSDGSSKWIVSNFSNKEINDGTWNSVGNLMTIDSKANSFRIQNTAAGELAFQLSSGGAIIINPNSTFTANVLVGGDFAVNGNTTVGNTSGDILTVNATASILNDLTVGLSSSQTLNVHSNTTFQNDVIIGSSNTDTLTVNSSASILDNLVIGVSGSQTLGVHSTTSFFNDVTIGNASGDTLTINSGSIVMGNDITVSGGHLFIFNDDLTVLGSTVLGNSSSDILTVPATATFQNNITIGSGPSNTLVVNSTLNSYILTDGGPGRVVKRTLLNAVTGSYGPATVDILAVNDSSPTAYVYTINNTGSVDGDTIITSLVANSGSGLHRFN